MSEDSGKSSAAATPSSTTSEPIWMGVGSPRPQPRVKQNSMFGHVVDAFDEKSIVKIGEVTPYEKKKKAQEEMQKAAAAAAAAAAEAEEQKKDEASLPDGSAVVSENESESSEVKAEVMPTPTPTKVISDSSAESRLLIKGGRIVNDDHAFEADIYIEDDQIKLVEANIQAPANTKIIDATGKLVIPGGIDTSTHFQAPYNGTASVDDFCHGTKSALVGGTTLIVDCVVPEKGQSLLEAYNRWRQWADGSVCCDYSLRVLVSAWSDQVAREMETLAKEKGVNTFVISMESEEMLDDTSLYQIFKHCRQLGAIAQVHPESGSLCKQKAKELFDEGITGPEGYLLSRSEEVEAEAVNRTIALGCEAGVPVYISNVTSKASAEVIEKSRRKGKCVFGEPMAASLAVDGSHYFNKCWRHAAGYVTCPPLRTWPNISAYLINLLANGDLLMVGSDHRTYNAEQKALGKDDFRKIPPGVNGVAERMSIIWETGVVKGKLDPCQFVAVTSTNAAKVFNLYPKKGRIAVGSDADLVVFDADETQTFSVKTQPNRCDFNIFEDMTCHGVAKYVVSHGQIVLDSEDVHVTPGSGRFTSNPSSPDFLYSKILAKEKAMQLVPVRRDPYEGPVPGDHQAAAGDSRGSQEKHSTGAVPHTPGEMYSRPPTRSGGRNMQDTTFSLSASPNNVQADDPIMAKKGGGTRVNQPPGGRSTQLW